MTGSNRLIFYLGCTLKSCRVCCLLAAVTDWPFECCDLWGRRWFGGKRCCESLRWPLSEGFWLHRFPINQICFSCIIVLVGEVFLGPRRRPHGPRPIYQQIPAVRHGMFCFSGISLSNYRYYIQTVKYKSKETLFGEDKGFFQESAELEPRLLNELKGNSLVLSQQPPTKGWGGGGGWFLW